MTEATTPRCWYVLRSKPRKEEALWQYATSQGYALFYPRIPVRTVNPRARAVVPYFPGYLFVHVALEQTGLSTFQWMPHSAGLVCFGGVPATVPAELIEAIHERVDAIATAGGEEFLALRPGDAVRVEHGPFAGYEGIFDARISGGDRVRVLLTMLNDRAVPVDLRVGQLKRRRVA